MTNEEIEYATKEALGKIIDELDLALSISRDLKMEHGALASKLHDIGKNLNHALYIEKYTPDAPHDDLRIDDLKAKYQERFAAYKLVDLRVNAMAARIEELEECRIKATWAHKNGCLYPLDDHNEALFKVTRK